MFGGLVKERTGPRKQRFLPLLSKGTQRQSFAFRLPAFTASERALLPSAVSAVTPYHRYLISYLSQCCRAGRRRHACAQGAPRHHAAHRGGHQHRARAPQQSGPRECGTTHPPSLNVTFEQLESIKLTTEPGRVLEGWVASRLFFEDRSSAHDAGVCV